MKSPRSEEPGSGDSMPEVPWYRVGIVWLVISGPVAVIAAGIVTMVIAWTHVDPLVDQSASEPQRVQGQPTEPSAPAMEGRNHAATPAR